MAFARKDVGRILESESMSIEEKLSELVSMHSETVNALKAELDNYKKTAEKTEMLQIQLDKANQKLTAAEIDDYKGKYESEKAEHDKLKGMIAAEKTGNAKRSAYREALKKAGVPDGRIPTLLKIAEKTDFDGIEFDDSNNLKDITKEIQNIKAEYGDMIPVTKIVGTDPETPPVNGSDKNGRTGIAARLQKQYQESMYGFGSNKEG